MGGKQPAHAHSGKIRITLDADRLHHAYAVAPADADVRNALIAEIVRIDPAMGPKNPDFIIRTFDVLSINAAREIKEMAARRPLGGRAFMVIEAGGAAREAQNALLKIFEEPARGAHIFLLVPSLELLLPTVRSRMIPIDARVAAGARHAKRGGKFLSAAPADRLQEISGIVKDKDARAAAFLLGEIERELARMVRDPHGGNARAAKEAARDVWRGRRRLLSGAGSVKLILEHVALTAPRIPVI